MSIRVKTIRAHYYGRDRKAVGEVYEGAEPAIYQLISSGKVEVTDAPVGTARTSRASPKPARSTPEKPEPNEASGD